MNIVQIILIISAAFVCELIDSSLGMLYGTILLGMLYGTILSPVLIIIGYDPLVVVPSILFSQAIGGIIASIGHHRLGNVDFAIKKDVMKKLSGLGCIEIFRKSITKDLKVVFVISCFGILATIVMGIILLFKTRFNFSWRKTFGIGILSAFNKGISGGGFGPVVTAGQLISGRERYYWISNLFN